jgi:hypothetical protein
MEEIRASCQELVKSNADHWLRIKTAKADESAKLVVAFQKLNAKICPISFSTLRSKSTIHADRWKLCCNVLQRMNCAVLAYGEDTAHKACRYAAPCHHISTAITKKTQYECRVFQFHCKINSWYFLVTYELDPIGDAMGLIYANNFYCMATGTLCDYETNLFINGDPMGVEYEFILSMMLNSYNATNALSGYNSLPHVLESKGFTAKKFVIMDFPSATMVCNDFGEFCLIVRVGEIFISHNSATMSDAKADAKLLHCDVNSLVLKIFAHLKKWHISILPCMRSIATKIVDSHYVRYPNNVAIGNGRCSIQYASNELNVALVFGELGFPHKFRRRGVSGNEEFQQYHEYQIKCSIVDSRVHISSVWGNVLNGATTNTNILDATYDLNHCRAAIKAFTEHVVGLYLVYDLTVNAD